jgi:hypothetical protein
MKLFKQKPKPAYAFTDHDWFVQRERYIRSSGRLNLEFERYKCQRQVAELNCRSFTLDKAQAHTPFRLPHGFRQIRVLTGYAWVAYRGIDYVLNSGDALYFHGDDKDVLISNLRSVSLVFEAIP